MTSLRTQEDIVKEMLMKETDKGKVVTDKVRMPGLSQLHLKPRVEIAESLVTVLKSRQNIKEIKWEIGAEFIEIKYLVP